MVLILCIFNQFFYDGGYFLGLIFLKNNLNEKPQTSWSIGLIGQRLNILYGNLWSPK